MSSHRRSLLSKILAGAFVRLQVLCLVRELLLVHGRHVKKVLATRRKNGIAFDGPTFAMSLILKEVRP